MSDILHKIAFAIEKGLFIKLRKGGLNFIKVFGMVNIHDAPVIGSVPHSGSHTSKQAYYSFRNQC